MPANLEYPIQILFRQASNDDPFLNQLTAYVGESMHGKGFCHTELCIPSLSPGNNINGVMGDGNYISSSIYNGETVTLDHVKTFANPGYVVHTILVDSAQLNMINDFIHDNHERKVSFDQMGMYLATFPMQLNKNTNTKTFCSKYVTQALQRADVKSVSKLNPNIVTPSKLYKVLSTATEDRIVAGSVDYKQRELMSTMRVEGLNLRFGPNV